MADLVVHIDEALVERFVSHAEESADKFALPRPVQPIVDALRAALDSPPVEEEQYQAAAEEADRPIESGPFRRVLAERIYGGWKQYGWLSNVRLQTRTATTFSDGSSLIGPWSDLEGEGGE